MSRQEVIGLNTWDRAVNAEACVGVSAYEWLVQEKTKHRLSQSILNSKLTVAFSVCQNKCNILRCPSIENISGLSFQYVFMK